MVTSEKKKVGVLVHPEKCTGCRVCQMECSFRYHKKFSPALANIRILETPARGLSYVIEYTDDCHGCLTCASACVFGALEVEKGGK